MLTTSTQSDLGLSQIFKKILNSHRLQFSHLRNGQRLYKVRTGQKLTDSTQSDLSCETWQVLTGSNSHIWEKLTGSTQSHLRKAHRLYTVRSEFAWASHLRSGSVLSLTSHSEHWVSGRASSNAALYQQRSQEKRPTQKSGQGQQKAPPDNRMTCLADKNKSSSRKAESQ